MVVPESWKKKTVTLASILGGGNLPSLNHAKRQSNCMYLQAEGSECPGFST